VSAGSRAPDPGARLRRRQVLGLLAGGMVAAAAGCSLFDPDEESAEFEGEGPIVFAAPRDFSPGEQRRVAVGKWNEEHPTSRAVSVDLPFAADLQRADLIARLQAGREDYDVLGLDVVWTAEFAEGRYIESLEPHEAGLRVGRFLTPALESARFGGVLMGLPLFSNAGLLYYRTDLVEQVPSTWDELADQARELSRPGRAGYVGQLARYEGLTVNLLEAIWGQGGDLLPPQQSGRPPDRRAWTSTRPSGASPSCATASATAGSRRPPGPTTRSRAAWPSRAARRCSWRNWPYAYDLLTAQDSPVRKDFEVAKLPGPSALSGANLAIARSSGRKKTGLVFMRFLTTGPVQRLTYKDGGYPAAVASIYEDPDVQANQTYTLGLRDSIKEARSRPSTPFYGQVTWVIQDAAFSVLGLGEEPATATRRLAERLPAALEGR
jgi:multiple sugar transport system substrate-binding protein